MTCMSFIELKLMMLFLTEQVPYYIVLNAEYVQYRHALEVTVLQLLQGCAHKIVTFWWAELGLQMDQLEMNV